MFCQILLWYRGYIKEKLMNKHGINSSSFGQSGCHFADDILICIFQNEKFCILIKTSLQFVQKRPIYNNPALVQIMAWRWIGAKPLSGLMLTWFTDAYMRHLGEISWWIHTPCRRNVNQNTRLFIQYNTWRMSPGKWWSFCVGINVLWFSARRSFAPNGNINHGPLLHRKKTTFNCYFRQLAIWRKWNR